MHRFTDKRVHGLRRIVVRLPGSRHCGTGTKQNLVSVGHGTAGRGETIGGMKIIEARHRLARRKNRCGPWGDRDIPQQIRHGQKRIPAKIMVIVLKMPHGTTVVIAKPISPVIPMATKLRCPGNRLHLPRRRSNPQIAAAQIELLTGLDRRDSPATITIGQVEPVVESPRKSIHAMLLIPLGKATV